MSTEAYKKLGEAAEDAGLTVGYIWNDRFDYLLEGIELPTAVLWNPDFDDEYFDAKFGGSDYYGAERMWRE